MDTENRVLEALDKVRPYLQEDGGDIRLVEVNIPIVKVELLGACVHCDMSAMTMKVGVEELIKRAVPEITSVVAINGNL
jgi:Fe-S cluster biogenesis protein NfuA